MRQTVHLPESWYEHTVSRPLPVLLTADTETDVCVIGGGLAGLTTALELSRHGKRVVLLERAQIAAGASGRNGGFVSNGFALGIDAVAAHIGLTAARVLYDLSRDGTAYVRDTIVKHDPSIKMGDGWRICVRHDDRGSLARYGESLQKDFGENLQFSSTQETRRLLDTTHYFSSLYFLEAFHIHPLRYALLMAELCVKSGVLIYESTKALAVSKLDAGFMVLTERGRVKAEHIVYCVSALDTKLHPVTARALLPVSTYIGVTEPLEQNVIRTQSALSDTRRAGDYYRLIDQGRILWGGRITTRQSEPYRLADEMRGDMLKTYPKLGRPRMDFAWGGVMGYALHKMPLIGRDGDGHWFATGFGGHGLNTTAMAGRLIAHAIARGDDTYRRFAAFAPHWTFGPLGRVGVQASYWWMQARDRFDETTKG